MIASLRNASRRFQGRNLSAVPLKMYPLEGGCYCGSIKIRAQLSKPLNAFEGRRCDCSHCSKTGAEYFSDAAGSLRFDIVNPEHLGKYIQGPEGSAEFLHCLNCACMVGVVHKCKDTNKLIGTVNKRAMNGTENLTVTTVSPKLLSRGQREDRWKKVWFQDVAISNAK